jgi:hypothetical protein
MSPIKPLYFIRRELRGVDPLKLRVDIVTMKSDVEDSSGYPICQIYSDRWYSEVTKKSAIKDLTELRAAEIKRILQRIWFAVFRKN